MKATLIIMRGKNSRIGVDSLVIRKYPTMSEVATDEHCIGCVNAVSLNNPEVMIVEWTGSRTTKIHVDRLDKIGER